MHKYKLAALLKYTKISRSTFYYGSKKEDQPLTDKYKVVKEEITAIYREHQGRYGYRRITLELRNRGYTINHKTVWRLMKIIGIQCIVRVKKYRSYRGKVGKVAPNIIQRNFSAAAPNQKWVTDITEFSLFGKKLYLSPILYLFNREIINYSISERPVLAQVIDMLDKAFEKIPDNINLVLHSDQGWQYQHSMYQKRLRDKGIRQSMSRSGNCLDNSVMENFFGLLKSELFYFKKFTSLEDFKVDLENYILYYNNFLIKSKLNGLSPVQFRLHSSFIA